MVRGLLQWTNKLAYLASRQKCRAVSEPSQYKADTRTLLELAVHLELLKHTKSSVSEREDLRLLTLVNWNFNILRSLILILMMRVSATNT